ncbi:MAG: hypothetical protein J7499_19260 [Sphingopyxis sp.]|nr:hypothetical protein [Sphingopyxis sp.]
MRQVLMVAGMVVLLAGCGKEASPEEQTASDERDVAMVEAANKAAPPVQLVTPEPILLPDIERYDLLGEECSYAPGTSLGARVIAREADAFMKIDGDIERFAADPGSRELPMHTRSVYNSKNYSLVLSLKEDTGEDEQRTSYEGSVTLRDEHGRIVYEGVGEAQCAAG